MSDSRASGPAAEAAVLDASTHPVLGSGLVQLRWWLAEEGFTVVSELLVEPAGSGAVPEESARVRVEVDDAWTAGPRRLLLLDRVGGPHLSSRVTSARTSHPVGPDLSTLRAVVGEEASFTSNADYARIVETVSRVPRDTALAALGHPGLDPAVLRALRLHELLVEADPESTLRSVAALADGAPLEWVTRSSTRSGW